MTISLTPELERFVEQKVRCGEYASADEAVNSMLRFVAQEDELTKPELDELKAQVSVGVEQADRGERADWDPDEIWAEVERRHSEQRENRVG